MMRILRVFSSEESVTVSQILIAVDPHAGPEVKEQARQKAEQIRQEILAGKGFAEMAKKHSNTRAQMLAAIWG